MDNVKLQTDALELERRMQHFWKSNVWMISLCVITALIPMVLSFRGCCQDSDSMYFLSIVDRVAQGYVPDVTMDLDYTPLFFYLLAGIKNLFNLQSGGLWVYLAVIYLFQIGCAIYIFKLSREFGASQRLSLFVAWLYLVVSHWLDANHVLLEIPSVFFGLASCYYVYANLDRVPTHYFLDGILASCSFLCKQFGLGFLFLGIYVIATQRRYEKLKAIVYLISGFVIPMVILFLVQRVNMLWKVFPGFVPPSFEIGSRWGFYDTNDVSDYLERLWYFIVRIVPFVAFSLLFVFGMRKDKYRLFNFIFCWLGILGFALQFFLTSKALNCYQYMVPFGLLLIPVCKEIKLVGWKRWVFIVALVVTVGEGVVSTYYKRVFKEYICENVQLNESNSIQSATSDR